MAKRPSMPRDRSPVAANGTQVDEFRHRLREARRTIARTLVTTDAELDTLKAAPAGALIDDGGAETAAAGTLSRLEGQERHELDEIEDALGRLESGTFGLCQTCGRSIALARLRAMPATRHCVGCRRKAEETR